MNNALMIDLETLALSPDAYVTQIGFCLADLDTRRYLIEPTRISTLMPQPGRLVDPSTVAWWMGQPAEVQKSVFNSDPAKTSGQTLEIFRTIYLANPGLTVWAKPAMFDLPILGTFWGQKPWSHRDERCLQTIARMLDPDSVLAPPPNSMAHDAAADSWWQMEYLMNLWPIIWGARGTVGTWTL